VPADARKAGVGQYWYIIARLVLVGCTKNVAIAAKVGQADGVKCGRLGVSWMYKKIGKCCKDGMG